MKRLLLTLALLCVSVTVSYGTTVTLSSYNLQNLPFNPTNIGTDRTFTVSTTNGSTTVTAAAGVIPSAMIGVAGFQIVFSGDSTQYVVAGVTSTTITLTTTFGGTTGSKTATVYKYVLLRTYATMGFQDSGGQNIQPGTPGSGQFYKQVAVSIINSGSGNVAWIPQFTIPSTTDAVINNQARYVMGFYRPDGSLLSYYLCGSVQQLAIPTTTPTTWTAICNYNAPGAIVPPNTEAYTKVQIDQRFPSCTADQLAYYAATGNIQACLSVGSGLQISSGTISATGGSTTFTATQVSTNYNILTTDWLVSVNTAGGSYTTTLYAAAGNSGRLVSVCKATTDVNTVTISDGVTTIGTLYAPTTCLQMMSNGTNWVIQSY